MPNQEHCPQPWGKSVGGVSERAGAKAGGSNPFARDSFACRGGERHPGLLEGGSLRGASSERGPRSVRSWSWVPPTATARRRQRMLEGCRGGERRRHAPQSACTRRRHEKSSQAPGDASFTRSGGPCTLILTMLRRVKPRRWGTRFRITVGQTHASERNQHWGGVEWT
jgi:hypothetical protein